MPTVFNCKGYKFFFYSNEGFEPPHIHVRLQNSEAKFWMPGCQLVWDYNFNAKELREILNILEENKSFIMEKWNEHFNG
jgi:hypothetical protein